MTTFTDRILKQAEREGIEKNTHRAREWFRRKVKSSFARNITSKSILKQDELSSKAKSRGKSMVGRLYFFVYDPKHKLTLPYYDRFPLIFVLSKQRGGFMGLNLHYLAPKARLTLMDALITLSSDNRYDDKTRLNMSYGLIKKASKYRLFKPTIKRYLTSHQKSRFIEVPASEWDLAVFLPVEQFEKASKTKVWSDSIKIAMGK